MTNQEAFEVARRELQAGLCVHAVADLVGRSADWVRLVKALTHAPSLSIVPLVIEGKSVEKIAQALGCRRQQIWRCRWLMRKLGLNVFRATTGPDSERARKIAAGVRAKYRGRPPKEGRVAVPPGVMNDLLCRRWAGGES